MNHTAGNFAVISPVELIVRVELIGASIEVASALNTRQSCLTDFCRLSGARVARDEGAIELRISGTADGTSLFVRLRSRNSSGQMIDNRRAVFHKSAERAASGPAHCRHVSAKKRLDRIARGGWRSKPVIDIPLVRRPRTRMTLTCARARGSPTIGVRDRSFSGSCWFLRVYRRSRRSRFP